jgi:hypothetical protein
VCQNPQHYDYFQTQGIVVPLVLDYQPFSNWAASHGTHDGANRDAMIQIEYVGPVLAGICNEHRSGTGNKTALLKLGTLYCFIQRKFL